MPLLALEATRWRLAVRGRALGMAGRGLHLGMVPLAMLLGSLIGATVLPAIPSVWAEPKLPLLVTAAGMIALREHEGHLVSINRFEKSPRTHAGNPTSADQEFLETWKPKLLEAVRKTQEDLEASE